MAVTQKSKIQVRRGRRENLPQLAAGELGWAVDTQQLFIGNGTFTDGAPAEGNTEIITEVSAQMIELSNVFTEATLSNNTVAATEFLIFSALTHPAGVINYSIKRNDVWRSGTLHYAANLAASTIIVQDTTTSNSLGITLTASVAGSQILIKYQSTDTTPAYNATIYYKRVDFF